MDVLSLRGKTKPVGNKEIISLLEKFSRLKVLVIGDVMIDAYVWGKVTRVSPEAPVAVVMKTNDEQRLGGAANVARNILSLGAEPLMCSVLGKDENAKVFRSLIKDRGLSADGLIESLERVTTTKTRIFAGHQQLLRVDHEVENNIDEKTESLLWQKIQELILNDRIGAIVFQDYDKGVITPGIIEKVISLGSQKGIPTLVDPKRKNFSHYKGATLFKPNFKELTEGLQVDLEKSDFKGIHKAAGQLQKDSGFEMVMITLSEHGVLISSGSDFKVVPTHARDVADVSGAGDTVIAMASLCLAAGMDAYKMAQLSNLAAGLVCERVGVVPVEKEWLLNADFSFGN